MDDPEFIVDDELERRLKFLERLDKTVKNKKSYEPETLFLRKFTMYLIESAGKKAGIVKDKKLISGEEILSKASNKLVVKEGRPLYMVGEPKLHEKDIAVLDYMRNLIGKKSKLVEDREFLLRNVVSACKKFNVEFSQSYLDKISYYLYKHFLGFGRLQPLIEDMKVTGIYCYGVNHPILVDYKEAHKIGTNLVFEDNRVLNDVVLKLGRKVGVEVSMDNPVLDISFSGLRVHAVYGADITSSRFIILREKS